MDRHSVLKVSDNLSVNIIPTPGHTDGDLSVMSDTVFCAGNIVGEYRHKQNSKQLKNG